MDKRLSLNSSAFYSIQLQGALKQNWADQFGLLQVHTYYSEDTSKPPVTTVVGEVIDQAALTGFINLVYSLGMPLLSVTYLGNT
jgi:hypothetical protein